MAKLSEEEKQELLRLSASPELKKDFRAIKKAAASYRARTSTDNLDDYLKFLSLTNAFVNHKRKKFHKIKGGIFRM